MTFDLHQLRTGVPNDVPRRDTGMARGGICPRCGESVISMDPTHPDDDPGYCYRCEEPIHSMMGDDAMQDALPIDQRLEQILYGHNDDSPTGNNYEGSHDNDLGSFILDS